MKDNVSSYFASPIYYEDKPEFLEDLNKICQPYIDDSIPNFSFDLSHHVVLLTI